MSDEGVWWAGFGVGVLVGVGLVVGAFVMPLLVGCVALLVGVFTFGLGIASLARRKHKPRPSRYRAVLRRRPRPPDRDDS